MKKQSYDLEETEIEVEIGSAKDRPFSNVFTQLDVTPGNYLSLTHKNEWSPYDGDFKRNEALLRLWDKRGDALSINYRKRRDEDGDTIVNEIDGTVTLNLWGGFSIGYRNNHSFQRKENLEKNYTLTISRQCWGISFSYVDKPDEKKFMVGFNLLGVGGLAPKTVPVGFSN